LEENEMDNLKDIQGIITDEELALTRKCLDFALGCGARKARFSLSKSSMDLFATLNGSLDKVTHCLDRVLSICLFVDGKYGSFSINRLGQEYLEDFIIKATDTVRMLAPDPCRDLPSPDRTEHGAISGNELGLFDPAYGTITADMRTQMALSAAIFDKYGRSADKPDGISSAEGKEFRLISEEGEYSDSVSDSLIIDSNGLYCRHIETSFDYGTEVTIEDLAGNKFSGYWWDSSSELSGLDLKRCGDAAVRKAAECIGPICANGGKTTMVVDAEVAGKLVNPIMNALRGFNLQQKNSFLQDTLGKKMFSEGFTLTDECRHPGKGGSRLFDSEGVATRNVPIIDKGVICEYFINTFISKKLGIPPTIEDYTRLSASPYLSPAIRETALPSETDGSPEKTANGGGKPLQLSQKDIIRLCRKGILVTGFNGGNNNPATGDFSYGIEGFAFENGTVTGPVREMVITGNFITLWEHLIAAGTDSRPCKINQIPTLAFSEVDFSA